MPWKRMMTKAATVQQQTRLQPRRAVVLCADFDQTLTTKDTIALLFQSAAARQKSAHAKEQHGAHVQRLVKQYASEMSDFVTYYHHKHKRSSDAVPSSQPVLSTAAEQPAHAGVGVYHDGSDGSDPFFDAAGLRAFLDGFGVVDLRSIRRVIDLKALQGIRRQDLVDNAKQIELMGKCVDVLASADAAYVISSNWSTAMLDATLNNDHSRPKIKIITNDLEMDADGVTTGKIEMRVQSPSDKAQWVRQIRMEDKELNSTGDDRQQQQQQSESPLIVFVGDSANDLLAMIEADVGISLAIGADSSFVKLADQFGVQMEPISTSRKSLVECAQISEEAKSQGRQVLFTANNWEEIGDAVSSH